MVRSGPGPPASWHCAQCFSLHSFRPRSGVLYVDTSCLLKVFFPEPEARVFELIAQEPRVIVSSLARLEALTHIHARVAGQLLSAGAAKRLVERFDQILQAEPYEIVLCPPGTIEVAAAQVRPLLKSSYCRALDRLHLALSACRPRPGARSPWRWPGVTTAANIQTPAPGHVRCLSAD